MDIWPQIATATHFTILRLWGIWSEYRIKYKSKGKHNITWSWAKTLCSSFGVYAWIDQLRNWLFLVVTSSSKIYLASWCHSSRIIKPLSLWVILWGEGWQIWAASLHPLLGGSIRFERIYCRTGIAKNKPAESSRHWLVILAWRGFISRGMAWDN